jgi:hypothetical protein
MARSAAIAQESALSEIEGVPGKPVLQFAVPKTTDQQSLKNSSKTNHSLTNC